MAKKTGSLESKKPTEEKSSLLKTKNVVVKASDKVVEAPEVPVVLPVVPTVKIIKKKKARYVREKKKSEPQTQAVKVTPRSMTAAGKTMTKNVSVAPKQATVLGPKSNTKRKPK